MFDAKTLTPKGSETVVTIKTAFHDLVTAVEKTGITNSREYSLFKTKLEEACFWGVRAASLRYATPTTGEETGPVS